MPETIAAAILSVLPSGVAVAIGGYLPAVVGLAGSALLQAGIAKLTQRRFTPEQQRFDLLNPSSRAVKRFVYGYYRAPASLVRQWRDGQKLYGLYILNSRASDCGQASILFDSRPSTIAEGDLFDFAGSGARLTITEDFPEQFGDERPRAWIGRGDQVGPPVEILERLAGDRISFPVTIGGSQALDSVEMVIDADDYLWNFVGGSLVQASGPLDVDLSVESSAPLEISVARVGGGPLNISSATANTNILGSPKSYAASSIPDFGGTTLLETDAFTGLTVLWLEIDAGANEQLRDRWPNGPRTQIEVEARWSKVWDPRDPAQDPDDPDTWAWSNNQALCALDAILHNPIRKRPRFAVDVDSFVAAANLADQDVALKAGGNVKRYTANGILTWGGGELMDQISPLVEAGAGELISIGGRLGYALPVASSPVYTIGDILGDGELDFGRLAPGSSLPVAVRASYVAPDRDWQASDLPALALGVGSSLTLEEGVTELPLQFVTEPTQAMRIQKITRNRLAAQKTVSCVLPPSAINLVAGSVVEWAVPDVARCNGRWRVRAINPNAWLTENGVALKCPVQLVQEPDALDAWDPALDEFDLATEDYVPPPPPRPVPGNLEAQTGADVALGATARIRISFDPVFVNVVGYEWQWREAGGVYAESPTIGADIRDAEGRVFAFLSPVVAGTEYQIRVRALYLGGVSDWVDLAVTAESGVTVYDANFDAGTYAINNVAAQLANLVSVQRASSATRVTQAGLVELVGPNVARLDWSTGDQCLLIEPAGGNAWTHSEALENAPWVTARATITANAATSPDGSVNAESLIETATTGEHYLRRPRSFVSGSRADFMVHAKADARSAIRIRCFGSGMSMQQAEIDLLTGAVTIVNGGPDVLVTDLASGWKRIEFGFVPNASPSGFFDLFIIDDTGAETYAGDGSSGVLLWGLQDGAGSYVPTTSSPGTRAADQPAMQGVTAQLDLRAIYADDSETAIAAAPVVPGYWPALTDTRLKRLLGTL